MLSLDFVVDVIFGFRVKGILCGLFDVLGKMVELDKSEGLGKVGGWIKIN